LLTDQKSDGQQLLKGVIFMITYKEAARLLSSKDYAGTLAIAGPFLEGNPSDFSAWHLTARAIYGLGETDIGLKNLRSLAEAEAKAGRPILALARIKELEDLQSGTDDLQKILAELYSADSHRLEETELSPPPIPEVSQNEPWDASDTAALISQAKGVLAVAWGQSLTMTDTTAPLPFIPLLSSLDSSHFVQLVKALERQVLSDGEIIIEQGTPGDAFFVVAEGNVTISQHCDDAEPRELARLGPGAFFGEMALISRTPRAAEVKANEHCVLLKADKSRIEELAGHIPEVGNVLLAFCHARMLENLMRVSPVLAPVPVARRPELIAHFGTDYFEDGKVVVEEGKPGAGLFLIVSGQAQVFKNDDGEDVMVAEIGPGDIFGEIALVMRRPSTATVVASGDLAVLFLPAEDFMAATAEYPELLKGAFDIALNREAKNNSILASSAAAADDLILV
jgi:CRP-like cAMP-binding protein